MTSRVVVVPYLGPTKAGDVGYRPHWYHLWQWRSALPLLLLANALLQVLDVATTRLALEAGAVEANPISASMMETYGFGTWAGIKLVLAGLFVAHLPFLDRLERPRQRVVTGASVLVMGLVMAVVVLSNTAMVVVARTA